MGQVKNEMMEAEGKAVTIYGDILEYEQVADLSGWAQEFLEALRPEYAKAVEEDREMSVTSDQHQKLVELLEEVDDLAYQQHIADHAD